MDVAMTIIYPYNLWTLRAFYGVITYPYLTSNIMTYLRGVVCFNSQDEGIANKAGRQMQLLPRDWVYDVKGVTSAPTGVPTPVPTFEPTISPVPTMEPTPIPSPVPTTPLPSSSPTPVPTTSSVPTSIPTQGNGLCGFEDGFCDNNNSVIKFSNGVVGKVCASP